MRIIIQAYNIICLCKGLVKKSELRYTVVVEDEVVFKPSAFSHGVTEADILKAMNEYLYDGPMDDDVNKRLLLGFDGKNNLLEIMYNIISENRINVFHAMKARKVLMALLK